MCAVLTLLMACRFARFEVARQEVLQLLAKPTRGVGAVAKMQLKEEALKAAHADFIQADQALVDQIEAQQQGLGNAFAHIVSSVTTVLGQFCGQASQVVKRG